MANLFIWLWLVTTLCFFVAIIRPSAFTKITKKEHSRKHLLLFFFAVGTVFFMTAGAMASPSTAEPKKQEPKSVTKIEKVSETKSIAFESKTEDDSTLAKGETRTKQEGVDGIKTLEYEVTYVDNKQTAKKLISERVTKVPITKIVANGTYVYVAPAPTPISTPTPSSDVYYANCTAVRNAGADPIYRGEPGYRSALDRDGDGIGCE